MKNIEELIKQHYETISCLQDEKEIKENLSTLKYDENGVIITEVSEMFQNDLNIIQEEINKEKEGEVKKLLEQEEKETQIRLNACLETISLIKNKTNNPEETPDTITVIFATNELTEKAYHH